MRFRILGPVEVQVDGGWTSISATKWRTVLAVLLLRAGEVVQTDQLISEVWPEDAPATAVNLISVYVLRLRRLIGDPDGQILVTRSRGYQLLAGPDDVDAQRFTRLAAEGRAALSAGDGPHAAKLLSEALGLWQGSRALADVPDSEVVSAAASGLGEARIAALELRINADLGCGRHAQVVPELRRLLAEHPLREGLWALLMRALYGSGRLAEALGAYAQAREVIAEELGSDPSAELQQLHEQMLRSGTGSGPQFSATKTAAADSPFTAQPSVAQAGTPPSAGPGPMRPGRDPSAGPGPDGVPRRRGRDPWPPGRDPWPPGRDPRRRGRVPRRPGRRLPSRGSFRRSPCPRSHSSRRTSPISPAGPSTCRSCATCWPAQDGQTARARSWSRRSSGPGGWGRPLSRSTPPICCAGSSPTASCTPTCTGPAPSRSRPGTCWPASCAIWEWTRSGFPWARKNARRSSGAG